MFRNGWNSPGEFESPGEFQPLRNMSENVVYVGDHAVMYATSSF
jgi:hypothetical protein